MNILLTNDDGIRADGLWQLHNILAERHTVTVVAPDRERSAVGHAITLHDPLRMEQMPNNGNQCIFAVNGTPADCVNLAVSALTIPKPDLVIAGFNPGANLGENIHYSGTVAAAREAALRGFPAMAVSIQSRLPRYYEEAARFVRQMAEKVLARGLPKGTLLNINLPDLPLSQVAGLRVCHQAIRGKTENFIKRTDPRHQIYYWRKYEDKLPAVSPQSDVAALSEQHISVTPLRCDTTDYQLLADLESWIKGFTSGPSNTETKAWVSPLSDKEPSRLPAGLPPKDSSASGTTP